MAPARMDPALNHNAQLVADPGNPQHLIGFRHLATTIGYGSTSRRGDVGNSVYFTAWVTDFSDNFSSTWNEETVYGRMDPLATFQGTQRNISMGLEIVAANKFEAINNTAKLDKLIRFLYPVYESTGQTFNNTLKAPPLMEMNWKNLIFDAGGDGGSDTNGLIGYIRNLTYTPVFEAGSFLATSPYLTETSPLQRSSNNAIDHDMFPQLLRVQFDFKVIHTHLIGWWKTDGGYGFGDPSSPQGGYPHGAGNEISRDVGGSAKCADGPWVPGSAINTSKNQRTKRLMMEEQAANSEILGAHAVAGGDRRRKRRQLTAMQGHDFNRGCEDTETRIGRYDLNALQRQQDRQGRREARKRQREAFGQTPAELHQQTLADAQHPFSHTGRSVSQAESDLQRRREGAVAAAATRTARGTQAEGGALSLSDRQTERRFRQLEREAKRKKRRP